MMIIDSYWIYWIYYIYNALNDGHNKITTISANISKIIGLYKHPNYKWADDELASIPNYIGFDFDFWQI